MKRVLRPYELKSGWAARRPSAGAVAYVGRWADIRREVLERDGYTCQLRFPGICTGRAGEVDHIRSVADGGSNDPRNLRAACTKCHRRRTGQQGAAARKRHSKRKEK